MRKLLIANRGEIALRILRTAQAMGIPCVAVYSDADADALHMRMADEAIRIGGAPAKDSYLNIDAILDAARTSGADAVHPGYGFLAENARFAEACAAAGLIFVGPPAAAIAAMGDKAAAKRLMRQAGIACIPGDDAAQDDAQLAAAAGRLGFPVMIKAAAGGGGRGMRHVTDRRALGSAVSAARAEAQAAFGDAKLILERALVDPRHIELQIFADRHGNVVHMGERDCSVQRRHQKLIEETPAPGVSDDLRRRMGATALQAVRAMGDYVGAGTVEFLLDRDGNYFFMEMNTRLQVEHAVTEAVTGIDLVEWQLRIARGERLPRDQDYFDAIFGRRGHAIEVRLCAEEPAHGFAPQSGPVAAWRAPPGLRVESALEAGGAVSPFYDSMVGKFIAVEPTRDAAIARMISALDATVLLGIATNRAFLRDCLDNSAFRAGAVGTAFVAEQMPLSTPAVAPVAAASAALLQQLRAEAVIAGPVELRGWSNGGQIGTCWQFADGMARHTVDLRKHGEGRYAAICGGVQFAFDACAIDDGFLQYRLDGIDRRVAFAVIGNETWIGTATEDRRLVDVTWETVRRGGAGAGDGRILAPVNGRVARVLVAPGQVVTAGQVLLTIESMKIEQTIAATVSGTVKMLAVRADQQVMPGAVLLELAPRADSLAD